MFTGFFTDRARTPGDSRRRDLRRDEERLRRLLQAPALRPHRFSSRCELGPFIVAHVCRERSLVVELSADTGQTGRQQQRTAFLVGLGFTVLHVCPRELRGRPRQVLRRIASALRPGSRR
jgi:very-short-patch-repair endonuclease